MIYENIFFAFLARWGLDQNTVSCFESSIVKRDKLEAGGQQWCGRQEGAAEEGQGVWSSGEEQEVAPWPQRGYVVGDRWPAGTFALWEELQGFPQPSRGVVKWVA